MPVLRSRLSVSTRGRRLAASAVLAVLALPAAGGAQAVDRRSEIRNLYATAAYEETLSLLALVDASGTSSDPVLRDDLDEYRALCLLALSRDADAERAMTSLVSRHPLSMERLEERSPKFVALYKQVRAKVVPKLAEDLYAAGKKHYEAGEFERATEQLRTVLSLLKSVPSEGSGSELELLASGFLALAERAPVAAPAPVPVPAVIEAPAPALAPEDVSAPAAEPAPSPVPLVAGEPGIAVVAAIGSDPGAVAATSGASEPAPFTPVPRLYTADDADVVPPVVLEQPLPRWTPPHDLLRRRSFTGRVEVIIGADGRVKAADILQPSFSLYDEQVLRATRLWRYQPATKRGFPVEYKRVIEYSLRGQ